MTEADHLQWNKNETDLRLLNSHVLTKKTRELDFWINMTLDLELYN